MLRNVNCSQLGVTFGDWSFYSCRWFLFPYMSKLICTQLKAWGDLLEISAVFSVKMSMCRDSALQLLGTLAPQMVSSVSSTLRDDETQHEFPLPALSPGISLQTLSYGNHSAYLVCFLFLRDHYPVVPDVQYLKNLVPCILSAFIVVSGRRVNLFLITPSWLDAEVHLVICFCCLVLVVLFFI